MIRTLSVGGRERERGREGERKRGREGGREGGRERRRRSKDGDHTSSVVGPTSADLTHTPLTHSPSGCELTGFFAHSAHSDKFARAS